MKLVNTNALGWERLEDGTSIESNKNSKITKFSHNGSLEDELSSIAQLKDAQSADAIKTFFYEAKSQKQTINKEVINAIQKSNRSLLVYKGLLSTISSTIQQNQNPFNRFKQTYQNSSTFSFSRKLIDSKLYNEQNNKVEQGIYQASPYIQIWQSGLILLGCCPDSTRQRANDGLFGRETLAQSIFFQRVCRDNGAKDITVNGVIGYKELSLMQLFFQKGIRISNNKLIDKDGKQVWLSINYVQKNQSYEINYKKPGTLSKTNSTINTGNKAKKINKSDGNISSNTKAETIIGSTEVNSNIDSLFGTITQNNILEGSHLNGLLTYTKNPQTITYTKNSEKTVIKIKPNNGNPIYTISQGDSEIYNSSTSKTTNGTINNILKEIKDKVNGLNTNTG
ncbi:MAG TPA: hypothetical protein PLW93_00440, partial [Candidatus Absconditabacterales bacterium]|nr:hypothetical protein [Candidatus Absconditabacterales bacterium]